MYTSVDPNAYSCIHAKTTRGKEAMQQSKTGQNVWLAFCHHFGFELVTILITMSI